MISILSYGSGNINAFVNIFKTIGVRYQIIQTANEVEQCSRLIFPGVGAFDPTMKKLNDSGLSDAIREHSITKQRPLLGVCVGMQCLLESSAEGCLNGLSIITGHCMKFDINKIQDKPKIPHMGWNSIYPTNQSEIFDDIDFRRGFYFLHSFHGSAIEERHVSAQTIYGYRFPCVISRGTTIGVQFHPEKSHDNGIKLIRNFCAL
jgi:glutamine amidotransferase